MTARTVRYHKANGLFVFRFLGKVRRPWRPASFRIWSLVLLGASLASPPLRTLQTTAGAASREWSHRCSTQAAAGSNSEPAPGHAAKAAADSCDLVFADQWFTVGSENEWYESKLRSSRDRRTHTAATRSIILFAVEISVRASKAQGRCQMMLRPDCVEPVWTVEYGSTAGLRVSQVGPSRVTLAPSRARRMPRPKASGGPPEQFPERGYRT